MFPYHYYWNVQRLDFMVSDYLYRKEFYKKGTLILNTGPKLFGSKFYARKTKVKSSSDINLYNILKLFKHLKTVKYFNLTVNVRVEIHYVIICKTTEPHYF